jgi:HSP20 family protein
MAKLLTKRKIKARKPRAARSAAALARRAKGEALPSGAITRWTPPTTSHWGAAPDFMARPFEIMRRISEEMDRWFDAWGGQGAGPWAPAIDVFERKGHLVVRAELAGLRPEDVRVELTDAGLVLEGERRSASEERDGLLHRSERSFGRFHRTIPLQVLGAGEAKAQFKDGVLEVTVPVPEGEPRGRRIPIESA